MEEWCFIKQVGQNILPTKNCQHYVQEVRGNDGSSIIVFADYDGNTTKDPGHVKRRKRTISTIEIDESINVY